MKNAIPTVKGWVHPKTGELLKAQKMTQKKVDELLAKSAPKPVEPAPEPEVKATPKRTRRAKKVEEIVEEEEVVVSNTFTRTNTFFN